MKQTHPNCKDTKCKRCLSEHLALSEELDRRIGTTTIDHLGRFHKWLKDKGISPETEYGWGSIEYFDEQNISDYVATWTE